MSTADAIRDFFQRGESGEDAGNVEKLSIDLGLSRATTYRLLKLFQSDGTVMSLLKRKRGRPDRLTIKYSSAIKPAHSYN
ncbi:hypothetical protein C5748_24990 [Phyllobacterium phragmitis]|uniref:Uncharacterized protein n=1 Tax=Phyllobacterium phragmitis TaxID=2670329 RepID=A0A2S9IJV8_9HYPH|nr:hypothetical protein [Phyllobacterium phragmitis]PRD40799.1 hypothetical protein C5748_24990 [Phyllobacterium phragmitis]